jgi:hypothetical protein
MIFKTSFLQPILGVQAKIQKVPSAVTVLTDDTFDAVVMNASSNVLVEYYAPCTYRFWHFTLTA